MDIFNVLTMIGGLCLFLFGMNLMGQALERLAHQVHAEEEQAQPADHREHIENIHIFYLSFFLF